MEKLLEMIKITKTFPPRLVANDNIDFDLREGEVHTLLGENGAGKTTLMNILCGLLKPDKGEIHINNKKVTINSPADSIDLGIGMIHQNFKLIPNLTIAENIGLCLQHVKKMKPNEVRGAIAHLFEEYNVSGIELGAEPQDLPAHKQQLVEILKILALGQKIVIFDEPTSVLAGEQIDMLLKRIRRIAEMGHSVVFISHKLNEVLAVSDRITVLRAGKVIGSVEKGEANKKEIVKMMVGRDIPEIHKTSSKGRETVLEVQNLKVLDDRGVETVKGVSFSVRKGEIFGIAGVKGNGQEEIVEAITGIRHIYSGGVVFKGRDITNNPPQKLIDMGIAYFPPKGKEVGLALSLSITENVILRNYLPQFFKGSIFLNLENIRNYAKNLIGKYNIVASNQDIPASYLSGGNRAKLVLARELERMGDLIVIFDPTPGLGVATIEFFHRKFLEAKNNAAILLFSSELDEIISLSDRVGVIFSGDLRIVERMEDFNREKLGLMMAGAEL